MPEGQAPELHLQTPEIDKAGKRLRAELATAASMLLQHCSTLQNDLPGSLLRASPSKVQAVQCLQEALQRLLAWLDAREGGSVLVPSAADFRAAWSCRPTATLARLKLVVEPACPAGFTAAGEALGTIWQAVTAALQAAGGVLSGKHGLLQYQGSAAAAEGPLEQLCLEGCRQLFCTVAMSGTGLVRRAGLFEVALVDEAAQLLEAESIILTHNHPGVKKLVMVRRWIASVLVLLLPLLLPLPAYDMYNRCTILHV